MKNKILDKKKEFRKKQINIRKKLYSEVINVFNETNYSSVVGLEKVPKKDVSKYGVINIKKKYPNFYSISDLVEKPKIDEAPSNLSVVGRYVLSEKIFKTLSLKKKGFGTEIQLTDAIKNTIKTSGVIGYKFEGSIQRVFG